jgi:hypothetical protein
MNKEQATQENNKARYKSRRSTDYSTTNGEEQQINPARSAETRQAQPNPVPTQLQTRINRIHKAKQPLAEPSVVTRTDSTQDRQLTTHPHHPTFSCGVKTWVCPHTAEAPRPTNPSHDPAQSEASHFRPATERSHPGPSSSHLGTSSTPPGSSLPFAGILGAQPRADDDCTGGC